MKNKNNRKIDLKNRENFKKKMGKLKNNKIARKKMVYNIFFLNGCKTNYKKKLRKKWKIEVKRNSREKKQIVEKLLKKRREIKENNQKKEDNGWEK